MFLRGHVLLESTKKIQNYLQLELKSKFNKVAEIMTNAQKVKTAYLYTSNWKMKILKCHLKEQQNYMLIYDINKRCARPLQWKLWKSNEKINQLHKKNRPYSKIRSLSNVKRLIPPTFNTLITDIDMDMDLTVDQRYNKFGDKGERTICYVLKVVCFLLAK